MAISTDARINLGNAGCGVPTKHLLAFRHDLALAKDAVYAVLDTIKIQDDLTDIGLGSIRVKSLVGNRENYLKRPDYGRKLNELSRSSLQENQSQKDIVFIISDGLSPHAVEDHAVPLLNSLLPLLGDLTIDKIIIVEQGRVAISDEIGELREATISVILIGERPGLSSPDSMGIYLTFHPKIGNTDEKRNCLSNIRLKGMPYNTAAFKLNLLIRESLRLKLSGVNLKVESIQNVL
jgi:ethanolamine ammonia-lyase small subunit